MSITRRNVNITIDVCSDIIPSVASFNTRNELYNLDLEHLPFREFSLKVWESESTLSNGLGVDDLSNIEKLAETMKVSREHTNNVINTLSKGVDVFIKFNVSVKGKRMIVGVDNMAEVSLDFNSTLLSVDRTLPDYIDDMSVRIISPSLELLVNSSKEERDRIYKFCLTSIRDIFTLLVYMSADSKIEIERDRLFESRERFEKVHKPSKNKKKNKKTSVSLIRNIEFKISKDSVLKNIEEYTSRKYERHTEEWFTKGYWRTYKSGKKVWIEPTIKRAKNVKVKSNKDINKTYEVKCG